MANQLYIVNGVIDGKVTENNATPSFNYLTTAFDNKGRELLYVKAGGSNISANAAVAVTTAGVATASGNGDFRTCAALTANYSGWVYKADYAVDQA